MRVWVPGCATGEEAYSIAICILEYMRQSDAETAVQIFGTDLSEAALDQARAGLYSPSIEADVSPERLRRFFVPSNGMYQIARSVCDMCIFARQNVTKDPPFSKLDLIVCRNLLIYLEAALQAKVARLFHYALKATDFLVLGTSETAGDINLFAAIDRQHKIYQRNPALAYIQSDFSAHEDREIRAASHKLAPSSGAVRDERVIDRLILERHAPPAVVLDAELRAVQFRGDTSPYLRHSPETATQSVMKLAGVALGSEIRRQVRSLGLKGSPVASRPVSIEVAGVRKQIAIRVMSVPGVLDPQYLVVFEDIPSQPAPAASPRAAEPKSARVKELNEELAATKVYLNSVSEEQEAATEELKSAHEEVQSSNEELQSTNEELLTAKEELQSTNEELTTVNDEMQSRNSELQQINNDLFNLLSSVNVPIVILGNDLRIRRFTPHAEKILSLLPSDIGRAVSDFHLKIDVPDLVQMCREVIDGLVPREREVQDAEGRLYSMWVRPYRTTDSRIDGVVLALFDITDRRQAVDARYRRLFETSTDAIVLAAATSGEIVDLNSAVTRMLGYTRARLLGASVWESELFRGSESGESFRAELRERDSLQRTVAVQAESGNAVWVDVAASMYSEGDRRFLQLNMRDAGLRKRKEEELHREEEHLREARSLEAVGRLAAGMASDFNNVLLVVSGASALLRERLANDPSSLQLLEQIASESHRAAALTRQLLAFGRKQIAQPAVFEIDAVIEEARQMLAVAMPMKSRSSIGSGRTPAAFAPTASTWNRCF